MTQDTTALEKMIDEQAAYLNMIYEGVAEGIREGLKEGIAGGVKKGAQQALQDCLVKGFIDIDDGDIGDMLREIPENLIKNSIEEGARQIFEQSTRGYVQRVSSKLVERIHRQNLNLSKEQIGILRDQAKKCQNDALNKALKGMPYNPFLKEISAGIQKALDQSVDRGFNSWEEKLKAEPEKLNGDKK